MELGFATHDPETRKLHISDEQLGLIGNFDETCLNLDGSSTDRGGRPEAYTYDPWFPMVGKGTCKSSLTSLLITSSTAASEAFPPHLQYLTKAKTKETMRLDYDIMEHAQQVLGSLDVRTCVLGQFRLDRTRREGWTRKSLQNIF